MATTPKGIRRPDGASSYDLPGDLTRATDDVDSMLVQELTTQQRDQLPASARWPGRTLWERLTATTRRLITWDEGAQQWREDLAKQVHAGQHASGGADPVTPASISAATDDHGHPPVVLPRRLLASNRGVTLGGVDARRTMWSATFLRTPAFAVSEVALSGHIAVGSTTAGRCRVGLEVLTGSTAIWGTHATIEERHSTNVHSYAQVPIEADFLLAAATTTLTARAWFDVGPSGGGAGIDVNLYRLYATEHRRA